MRVERAVRESIRRVLTACHCRMLFRVKLPEEEELREYQVSVESAC